MKQLLLIFTTIGNLFCQNINYVNNPSFELTQPNDLQEGGTRHFFGLPLIVPTVRATCFLPKKEGACLEPLDINGRVLLTVILVLLSTVISQPVRSQEESIPETGLDIH